MTQILSFQDSDGEKSDDNLVVDVSNEVSVNLFSLYLMLVISFFFYGEGLLPPTGSAGTGNTL